MYQTGVKDSFAARHRLVGDFGRETIEHAHGYTVEWTISVEDLDESGFGFDIDLMAATLNTISRELDGSMLNELAYFRARQPSVEHLARHIAERAVLLLEEAGCALSRCTRHRIQIWESESAWAAYEQETLGS